MKLHNFSNDQSYLIIPIETKVRELHAKLLLSCFAAEEGFNVIFGNQIEIQRNLRYFPRGIYIDKAIVRSNQKHFKRIKKIGNCLTAWCEEGLAFRDRDTYLNERISNHSYKFVDLFFSWGDFQTRTIKIKIKERHDKIICTGNPRFDLLRYPYRLLFSSEMEMIQKKYGRFILINSNFSRYNHFYGREFVIKTLKEQNRIRTKEEEAFFIKWADFLGELYHHFLDMTKYISKIFPNYTIVIRPHPSENQETWKEQTKNLPNVKIIHDGNVIPWILASDVMIHNSCTTGVEAFILNAPVICYTPVTSEIFDAVLPNSICRKASNKSELADLLKMALDDQSGYVLQDHQNPTVKLLVEDYIKGLSGPTASENIVSALKELADKNLQIQEHDPKFHNMSIRRRIEAFAYLSKPILNRIIKGYTGGMSYARQKFPGLKLQEVQQFIDQLGQLNDRFASLDIVKLPGTKTCFLISKDT